MTRAREYVLAEDGVYNYIIYKNFGAPLNSVESELSRTRGYVLISRAI
jgi:hypothetical protein